MALGLPLGEIQGSAAILGGSEDSDPALGMEVPGRIQQKQKARNLPWSGAGEKRGCRKIQRSLLLKRNKFDVGTEKSQTTTCSAALEKKRGN